MLGLLGEGGRALLLLLLLPLELLPLELLLLHQQMGHLYVHGWMDRVSMWVGGWAVHRYNHTRVHPPHVP